MHRLHQVMRRPATSGTLRRRPWQGPEAYAPGPRPRLGIVPSAQRRLISISKDTADVNAAVLLNNPLQPVYLEVIVGSGFNLYGSVSGAGQAGLDLSGLPSGSVVVIHVYGTIWGKGGNAGSADSGAGTAGGDAIKGGSGIKCFIFNHGNIWGGGGGGGGGSASATAECGGLGAVVVVGGGGGGGGQGFIGGNAGSGSGSGAQNCGPSGTVSGSSGTVGNSAGPGSGGAVGQVLWQNGWDGKTCGACTATSLSATNGATGGTCGVAGSSSSGGGGAAGKAINLNGMTVTFINGNNGTQVKGAVS